MILQDWANFFGVNQSTLCEHLQSKSFDDIFDFYSGKAIKQLLTDNQELYNELLSKIKTT